MYLRWQARKRQRPAFGYSTPVKDRRGRYVLNQLGDRIIHVRRDTGALDIHWSAIVCENVRDNGKPTRRHVAVLGGITESGMAHPSQRAYFWRKVCERLDRLGNRVSADDRKRFEAAIAAKVPKLTEQEFEESLKRQEELFGDYRGTDGRTFAESFAALRQVATEGKR